MKYLLKIINKKLHIFGQHTFENKEDAFKCTSFYRDQGFEVEIKGVKNE